MANGYVMADKYQHKQPNKVFAYLYNITGLFQL